LRKFGKKLLEKVKELGTFVHSTKRWKTTKTVHFKGNNFFVENFFATFSTE
jgi:hypothetical protein